MRLIIKNTEEILLQALETIKKADDICFVVHFHFSKLQAVYADSKHLQIALNILKDELENSLAEIYLCCDRDLIILSKGLTIKDLKNLITKVRYLFIDDPLALNEDAFSNLYDLRMDYEKIYIIAKQKHALIANKTQTTLDDNKDLNINLEIFRNTSLARKHRDRLKVLVVEDHEFSRKLVATSLGKNFDVISASDGMRAIELYTNHAPDLVFLDIGLPVLDGHAVLKKITSSDRDSFVVMLSANTQMDDVKGAIASGAKGFIAKPFTKDKIFEYVQRFQNR